MLGANSANRNLRRLAHLQNSPFGAKAPILSTLWLCALLAKAWPACWHSLLAVKKSAVCFDNNDSATRHV